MFFNDEPAWMRKARTVPLYSTWESRQRRTRFDAKPAPAIRPEALRRAIK